MVINSLFIINTIDNKIFMEKHWRAAIKRSIMDEFMDKLRSLKVRTENKRFFEDILISGTDSYRKYIADL